MCLVGCASKLETAMIAMCTAIKSHVFGRMFLKFEAFCFRSLFRLFRERGSSICCQERNTMGWS